MLAVAPSAQIAQNLIENDRAYFRAGARCERIDGWAIVHHRGFVDLAAGCVLEPPPGDLLVPWSVIRRLKSLGCGHARFYRPGGARAHAGAPACYQLTEESLFATPIARGESRPLPDGVEVRALAREDDALKIALYESVEEDRPDGRASRAERYAALDRVKIEAGFMEGYLLLHGGEPAGCFGLSRWGEALRLNNPFTSARNGDRDCGAAMVAFARNRACDIGAATLGDFAAVGGPAERVYEECGMATIGAQTEFFAPLALLEARL